MKKLFLLPVLVIGLTFISCQKETVEPQLPTQEEPGIKQKMTGPTTGETQTNYKFTATSTQFHNSNYTYSWSVSPSSGAQLVSVSGYSATYKFTALGSYEVTISYYRNGVYAGKESMVIAITRECIPFVCPKPHYANLSISGPTFCHTGPFNPDPVPYQFTASITNPNDYKYNWTLKLVNNGSPTGFVAGGGRVAEVEFTDYGNHFLSVEAVCLTCNKAVAWSQNLFISVTIHGEEWWNQ